MSTTTLAHTASLNDGWGSNTDSETSSDTSGHDSDDSDCTSDDDNGEETEVSSYSDGTNDEDDKEGALHEGQGQLNKASAASHSHCTDGSSLKIIRHSCRLSMALMNLVLP